MCVEVIVIFRRLDLFIGDSISLFRRKRLGYVVIIFLVFIVYRSFLDEDG